MEIDKEKDRDKVFRRLSTPTRKRSERIIILNKKKTGVQYKNIYLWYFLDYIIFIHNFKFKDARNISMVGRLKKYT